MLSGTNLYRWAFDTTLLRCMSEKEALRLIEETHEGICGPHMSGYLANKITKAGYFWLTMEVDCIKHVRHYYLCQIYTNKINAPPKELQTMSAPWPISM